MNTKTIACTPTSQAMHYKTKTMNMNKKTMHDKINHSFELNKP